MEKVFTGSLADALMHATTALESRPPLRKAPRGTSLMSRERTASVAISESWSVHAEKLRSAVTRNDGAQYLRVRVLFQLTVLEVPGARRSICW